MTAPVVGELCNVAPGLLVDPPMLLITHVADGYVLAVPVTPTSTLTGPPALVVDGPDGEPLALWARAETGLDVRVLGHHVAMLATPDEVAAMRRYAEDDDRPPFAASTEPYDADGVRNLLLTMQALCFHEPAQETR